MVGQYSGTSVSVSLVQFGIVIATSGAVVLNPAYMWEITRGICKNRCLGPLPVTLHAHTISLSQMLVNFEQQWIQDYVPWEGIILPEKYQEYIQVESHEFAQPTKLTGRIVLFRELRSLIRKLNWKEGYFFSAQRWAKENPWAEPKFSSRTNSWSTQVDNQGHRSFHLWRSFKQE